jgi:hypothetical protein
VKLRGTRSGSEFDFVGRRVAPAQFLTLSGCLSAIYGYASGSLHIGSAFQDFRISAFG